MGSTQGYALRNRRTVLFALILAAASAIAALLLSQRGTANFLDLTVR